MNQNNVVLVISLLVVLAFVAAWVLRRMKLYKARSWPMGEGKVDSTDVRLTGSGTRQAKFLAEITYSYTVEGAAYSGHLRRSFMLHGSATKWTDGYASGRPLIVRYNPNNARDSVLLEDEQTGAGSTSG